VNLAKCIANFISIKLWSVLFDLVIWPKGLDRPWKYETIFCSFICVRILIRVPLCYLPSYRSSELSIHVLSDNTDKNIEKTALSPMALTDSPSLFWRLCLKVQKYRTSVKRK